MVVVDGDSLTLEQVLRVARGGERVTVTAALSLEAFAANVTIFDPAVAHKGIAGRSLA